MAVNMDVEMRNGLEKGGGEGRKWTWNQQGSNARDEFAVTCTRETVRIKTSIYGVYKIETIERVEFCVEWVINY